MPNGQGPRLLRDREVRAAAEQAAASTILRPADWGPPALYAKGRWPRATYGWVKDPQLRHALETVQDWVRTLRHARDDQRLSLRQLSKTVRAPVNTLSEVELGARWPSLPTLLRMSHALGVTLDLQADHESSQGSGQDPQTDG